MSRTNIKIILSDNLACMRVLQNTTQITLIVKLLEKLGQIVQDKEWYDALDPYLAGDSTTICPKLKVIIQEHQKKAALTPFIQPLIVVIKRWTLFRRDHSSILFSAHGVWNQRIIDGLGGASTIIKQLKKLTKEVMCGENFTTIFPVCSINRFPSPPPAASSKAPVLQKDKLFKFCTQIRQHKWPTAIQQAQWILNQALNILNSSASAENIGMLFSANQEQRRNIHALNGAIPEDLSGENQAKVLTKIRCLLKQQLKYKPLCGKFKVFPIATMRYDGGVITPLRNENTSVRSDLTKISLFCQQPNIFMVWTDLNGNIAVGNGIANKVFSANSMLLVQSCFVGCRSLDTHSYEELDSTKTTNKRKKYNANAKSSRARTSGCPASAAEGCASLFFLSDESLSGESDESLSGESDESLEPLLADELDQQFSIDIGAPELGGCYP